MYVNGVNLTNFQIHTVTQNYTTWTNSLTMHGAGYDYMTEQILLPPPNKNQCY